LSVKIPDEQFRRLTEVTQGWITGIQLILPNYPDATEIKNALNGFLATNLPLFDYFAQEIFTNETKKIQRFLTLISIFDDIYPKQCKVITGISGTSKNLNELEKRNIFITSLGVEKKFYRFHPLFRQFLIRQLKERLTNSQIVSLYGKAAKSFRTSGDYEKAIEYYIQGSKYTQAAQLVERIADEMMRNGKISSLQNWLSEIPDSIFKRRPWLNYHRGFLLDRIENRLDEALDIYRQTRLLFKKKNNHRGMSKASLEIATILCRKGFIKEARREVQKAERYCPVSDKALRLLIYNIQGMVAEFSGRYSKVKKYLQEMLKLAEKLKSPSFLVLTHCNSGVFYTMIGDFNAAEKNYEEAMRVVPKERYFRSIGLLYANAAYVKIQKGKFEEARQFLQEGMDICIKYNTMNPLITIRTVLGDLYLAEGDLQRALEEYKKSLALSIERGEEHSRLNVLESLCSLYLKKNDVTKALEYFRMIVTGISTKQYICSHPSWVILESEIKIAQGQRESAMRSLKKLLPIVQKKRLYFLIFEINLNLAWLYKSLSKNCLKYLDEALKISKTYGYEQTFLMETKFLELLRKVIAVKEDNYIRTILSQTEKRIPKLKDEILCKIKANFFGIPEIFGDGHLINNWTSEKSKKLFAFFIVNRERKISKEEITEIFWPGWKSSRAENNLSSTLYFIRKALMPKRGKKYAREIILYQNRVYYLDPGLIVDTDVKQFESLINEVRIQKSVGRSLIDDNLLNRTISLYRGHFCANWYDSWIESQRITYENVFLNLLTWAAEDAFTQNSYEKCLEYCEKAVSIDPYNEEIYYFLIKSLLETDRKSEAVSSFNSIIQSLSKIGTTPSAKILGCKAKLFK
jgi:LuxR family maltose regulon positive regulatory protein